MTDIVDELKWRGLFALSTDEDALRKALADGPVTFYCGFDPTAASLHVGHLVQVLTMRRLQQAGHRPLAPGRRRDRPDRRPAADRGAHAERPGDGRELGGPAARRRSSRSCPSRARTPRSWSTTWTGRRACPRSSSCGTSASTSGSTRCSTKDSVARRLESDEGISYTEFSYQLLQGMDFLELYRRYGCTLQQGGSDQWGNLTAGLDLIHRLEPDAEVHALATPLMTKADGTKFGKTEGGAVWLDPEMTTPYAFYQFWLNVDDRDISDVHADPVLQVPRGAGGAGEADRGAAAGACRAAGAGRGADDAGARRRPVRRRDRRVEGAVRPGRAGRARRADAGARRSPSCRTPRSPSSARSSTCSPRSAWWPASRPPGAR